MGLQAALLHMVYPPQCVACDAMVSTDFGLCGRCWRETPFIAGLVCDQCGTPLPGEDPGHPVHCDDCLTIARPWSRGRAALLYRDRARGMVLQLKHADRQELARPAGGWLMRAAQPILQPDMLIAPVPLHWLRLLRRRYNQSALLSTQLARLSALDHCPDLLQRQRNTQSQEGRGRDGRFANLADSIRVHPRRRARVEGRQVLLVDDVMTSGATLAAAAEACLAVGAAGICVLVLCRVAKEG
ncbi:MAG: double zinc ribbon domain-containing protein [Pseudotabrizicola sp.]|uniref:double zinc ribbon domain-containing protein n=1 Tax=Pseudotabrizicola sp. TaxID=2939647 RepID=UPI002723E5FC|nr:double zinc ribbon domain-containing protein [Pseudotabrizicola sp.]MDO9639261.1 double zinc ribbon domain-containing protein [Pseudotabrizicola sp.]